MKVRTKIDIIILLIIIILIGGILAYTQEVPPVYVVASESMEHSANWTWGTINAGDVVLVKRTPDPVKDIVTYVVGRETGYSTYGEFGNVILYHGPGKIIIHRAIFYLTWNGSHPIVKGYTNQSWITVNQSYVLIRDVGFSHRNLLVMISGFHNESGFITVGDFNLAFRGVYNQTLNAYQAADQYFLGIHPVTPSEIVGVAQGQIPWFGLIKLNIMELYGNWPYSNEVPNHAYEYLFASIVVIVALALFPYGKVYRKTKKWKSGRKNK
ncbi:S26 family signal peptidase [Oxyplasma meridianum]|uniref:S26 family signal peptidase n=1 Tax=Oxyplasma meridianum TaxID=3073602 RepID=A0AAX4NG57_9ARCH